MKIKYNTFDNFLKYLNQLDIQLSFEELAKMSKLSIKKLVKQQTTKAAFKYLTDIQIKQSKISHIKYDDLQIQEYLLDGNRNTDVSKFIYKARSMTLNIKTQKSWKYSDKICVGCGVNSETGDEILSCTGLIDNKNDKITQSLYYDMLFSGKTSEMTEVAKTLINKLKVRDKILEEPD